jgi:hypothetical protein
MRDETREMLKKELAHIEEEKATIVSEIRKLIYQRDKLSAEIAELKGITSERGRVHAPKKKKEHKQGETNANSNTSVFS